MSELPARARLLHVIHSLAARLPEQMTGLLDAPRFADGAAALARLSDPSHAREAVNAMVPDEATWMADRLIERWERIAPVVLEPAAFIVIPETIWLADRPARVSITLATIGVDDDWDAVWEGAVAPGPASKTSVLLAPPPEGEAPAEVSVRARVRARANGQRCLLIAEARVALRRPRVIASDDGQRFVITDHTGRPAAAVRVEIGEHVITTGANGLVELPRAPLSDTPVRVEGVLAGRTR